MFGKLENKRAKTDALDNAVYLQLFGRDIICHP
jgi:hypothetical protein